MNQETIALGIVALTVTLLGIKFYRIHLASFLSQWLLNRGQIKLAKRIRKQVTPKSGCASCKA